MKKYTLKEIEQVFNIPLDLVRYLIKKDIIEPLVENNVLFISEEEIKRFLSLPAETIGSYKDSYFKTLGPGIITGASDDDPSGIGTYSTVGSRYGLSLTWLALYLLPMMTAVQETCARIGIVTNKGLAQIIIKRYGTKIFVPLAILLIIANTINIGADIGAMAASMQLLLPSFSFSILAIIFTFIILFLEINFSYHKYSTVLKWLSISLFAYIITGFIAKPDWGEVFHNIFVPHFSYTIDYLAAVVAVMGTTISPYLFFWQTSEEIEDERDKKVLSDHHILVTKSEIQEMRKDVITGMSFANLAFLFIVITTASVLFKSGVNNIETASQAALALRPLAGDNASYLFTLGIVGTGLLAIPVLAGSSAYAISELFKWKEGLYRKYSNAKGFYGIIIVSMLVGLSMNFLGINPIKALYFAAIVNGITAPIILYFVFNIGKDKSIMGGFTSPKWVNFFGVITVFLMGLSAAGLLILSLKNIF
jgi:NRAMP (natural resistance-associated macrophage protein)-like metal ion transporter